MFFREIEIIKKELNKYNAKGMFQNKTIYLFGVSEQTRYIAQFLRTNNIEPKYIIDNDPNKIDTYIARIKVTNVNVLTQEDSDDFLVIICTKFFREIVKQLKGLNIKDKNMLTIDCSTENIYQPVVEAVKGAKIYKNLIRKYGDVPIFICPYTGTGDIYLIGAFWEQYLEKNKIDDYIFVVINNVCKKVADIFNIKNIEVLNGIDESEYLIRYYMLDNKKCNLKILNDGWGKTHINCIERFRGYKGLDFTKMFRKFVFDLPDDVKPKHPILKNVDEEIDVIFKEKGLEYGNTVILSPYSNTLADLPLELWENIAKDLLDRGMIVCTNSSGESEPAILNTISLFFPIGIASQFVEKAGYFIGVRSGFCDIISSADAKKIILYDAKNRFYNCSAYEYFSLKKMQLSDDVVELQYYENSGDLTEQILDNV